MDLAPIALFVYNRPEILKKSIYSLKKNKLVEKSMIYIFSDGAKKNSKDKILVNEVRKIINNTKNLNIKKVIFHKNNIGLKRNIISGINFVLKKNKKIIVLEDDIYLSPNFLKYMNRSLDFIKKEKNIWHVSAWNYPIKLKKKNLNDVFLWQNMNCWGWGTHRKYWKKINLDSKFFIKNLSKKNISDFNLNNTLNNWSQLQRNYKKKINTWAIFWNATIFWNNAFCLNPARSYTVNIGFESDSTHTKKKIFNQSYLNKSSRVDFNINEKKNEYYVKKIKLLLYKSKSINTLKSFSKKILNFLG